MITGAYSIIYSTDPDADRSFLRDVLQLSHAEASDGWLIFKLPLAELAVHPGHNNNMHEVYLLCDDIIALQEQLSGQNVPFGKVDEFPWGMVMRITLPGGGSDGIYQARLARPAPAT
jgi:hypothetical protein